VEGQRDDATHWVRGSKVNRGDLGLFVLPDERAGEPARECHPAANRRARWNRAKKAP